MCMIAIIVKSNEKQVKETVSTWSQNWLLLCNAGSPLAAGPGLGAGYLVLIVGTACALVAGAIALLVRHYQRMTGQYDLKARTNNFSYQVFHE